MHTGTVLIDHFGIPFMIVNGEDKNNPNIINLNTGLYTNRIEIACPWVFGNRGEIKLSDLE